MAIAALHQRPVACDNPETRLGAMIDYLRAVVLAPNEGRERCHAIFVDARRCYLGDAACGMGSRGTLSLRMRAIFADALRLDAQGMILAHNHPSGHCRPSGCDIAATRRLADMARALDIELVDHLIMTREAIYSMRAGGLL